jgi:hypothetical protein
MTGDGRCVYGFISTNEQKTLGLIGIEQGEVLTFPHQDIAAVVSELPLIQFNSLPKETLLRNLAVHQAVIERVMKSHKIIPMKFGTVVQGEEEIKRLLKKGYEQIKANLREMANKIELDVAALWSDLNPVLKEIGEEEEIKRIKEQVASEPPDQVFETKIKVGKMVKASLDKKRDQNASQILNTLRKEAEDHRSHDIMDDSMVMNVAFLIKEDHEELFESKVHQLDEQYKGRINFRIVGPLPPYSFSTLEMERMEFRELNEARGLLGLGEDATIGAINEAYKEMSKKFHPDGNPDDQEAPKRFEKITKAYQMLSNYCQEDRCSFKEVDVTEWIAVRPLEQPGIVM